MLQTYVLEYLQKISGGNIVFIIKYLISSQMTLGKSLGWAISLNVDTEVDYKLHEGKNDAALFTAMFLPITALKNEC